VKALLKFNPHPEQAPTIDPLFCRWDTKDGNKHGWARKGSDGKWYSLRRPSNLWDGGRVNEPEAFLTESEFWDQVGAHID
jgi:hypothetical protein